MAGALHDVQAGSEERRAAEGKNHRVGVQWSQAAEAEPGLVKIEGWPVKLSGDEHPHQHADDAPENGGDGKLPHNLVVIETYL